MNQTRFSSLLPAAFLRDCAREAVDLDERLGRRHKLRLADAVAADLREVIRSELGPLAINDRPALPEEVDEVVDAVASEPISPFFRAFMAQVKSAGIRFDHRLSEMRQHAYVESHWKARWAMSGLPVFSLTHGLAAALLLTDPPPFEPETFQLPFPAFAIVVPQEFVPVSTSTERSWGEVVRVHRMFDPRHPNRGDFLHVDATSRGGRRIFRLKPTPEILADEDKLYLITDDDPPSIEDDNRSFQIMLRLVRNLVAWIDAHGRGKAEGKPIAHGARYGRDRDGLPVPTTWVLGREVKLAPELRRMACDVASGDRSAGWKLRMRFCVRGHWKWQVCGEGRKKRKRIFVQPYWKGPEGAAAWSHVYTGNTP